MSGLDRRRFLAIAAAAAGVSLAGRADVPVARWRGTALGAPASMTLAGLSPDEAAPVFAGMVAEIARLEDVFSLYRPQSALCRLNREGRLAAPPPEMVELLGLSGAVHAATDGAFDPTVQPLWRLHAEAAERGLPPSADLAEARASTGWRHVRHDGQEVAFARRGMALTLNGIAQGYIADRIAARLSSAGLRDVLVDMGEIVASGARPDGTPWRAGIVEPSGAVIQRIAMTDRALATSAPRATVLDHAGRVGHIIDPRSGKLDGRWRLVSVSAARAAVADALSTAFCLMPRAEIELALRGFPDATVETLS